MNTVQSSKKKTQAPLMLKLFHRLIRLSQLISLDPQSWDHIELDVALYHCSAPFPTCFSMIPFTPPPHILTVHIHFDPQSWDPYSSEAQESLPSIDLFLLSALSNHVKRMVQLMELEELELA